MTKLNRDFTKTIDQGMLLKLPGGRVKWVDNRSRRASDVDHETYISIGWAFNSGSAPVAELSGLCNRRTWRS